MKPEHFRFFRDALVTIVLLIGILAGIAYVKVKAGGLSSAEQPGRIERAIARRLVRLSVSDQARTASNPYATIPDAWRDVAEHYNDDCVACHGHDGRGTTTIGQNMYPKVPDLASPATQQLSDGELFEIIRNGVRWTGMPAWANDHTSDDMWKLVSLIRHVPSVPAGTDAAK